MSHQDFTEITFSKRGVRGAGQGKAAFVNQQKRSGNMTTVKGYGTGGNTSKLAVGGGRNMTTLDNDHSVGKRTFRARARPSHRPPSSARATIPPPHDNTSPHASPCALACVWFAGQVLALVLCANGCVCARGVG